MDVWTQFRNKLQTICARLLFVIFYLCFVRLLFNVLSTGVFCFSISPIVVLRLYSITLALAGLLSHLKTCTSRIRMRCCTCHCQFSVPVALVKWYLEPEIFAYLDFPQHRLLVPICCVRCLKSQHCEVYLTDSGGSVQSRTRLLMLWMLYLFCTYSKLSFHSDLTDIFRM
jgi:hypothetical protein